MDLSSKELSSYLRSVHTNASKLDKLKIAYRPYVCPFCDLLKDCSDSKKVFDIGCGSGQFLLLLSKYTNVIKLGGVEILPALVKNANELLINKGNIEFQIEIFDGMNFPGFVEEFDTLTLIDVFHHIKGELQNQFIYELYRKMKVGSKLVFKDINAAHPFVYMNKLHDLILGGGPGNEISVFMAKKMLMKAGFTILSESKRTMLWYPHYTIICKK